MWQCPACGQTFRQNKQNHSCNERTIADFLKGKSDHTVMLYNYFVDEFKKIGEVKVYPAKTMIVFASTKRFAYIPQLARNFIDVVFPFEGQYEDNLCFQKIKNVPGSNTYNHYFRMYYPEDVNDEVKMYMKKAYDLSLK